MTLNPQDLAVVIDRGRKVREVRNSESFMDTVNDLSTYFMSQIAACPTTDAALPALRHAHVMHAALAEIVSHMDGLAAAGENAERILADLVGDEEDSE